MIIHACTTLKLNGVLPKHLFKTVIAAVVEHDSNLPISMHNALDIFSANVSGIHGLGNCHFFTLTYELLNGNGFFPTSFLGTKGRNNYIIRLVPLKPIVLSQFMCSLSQSYSVHLKINGGTVVSWFDFQIPVQAPCGANVHFLFMAVQGQSEWQMS